MKYDSLNTYEVKGRGLIHMVKNDKDRSNLGDKDGLIGSIVTIDGGDYKVLAVESFATATISKGDIIGLLIDS